MRAGTGEGSQSSSTADADVRWLGSSPERTGLLACRDLLARPVQHALRILSVVVAASAVATVIPNEALAPISHARASVDPDLAAPPPVIALAIPIRPIFAASQDEDPAVPSSVRVGSRDVPRALLKTIVKAAGRTGVDPTYLMALADKESSLRPEVRAATTTAEGLYQFVDATWLALVRDYGPSHGLTMEADAVETAGGRPVVADDDMREKVLGLRRDPYLAAVMAGELLKRDGDIIADRLGRDLSRTELYLAHFLGQEGAARFIALRAARRPQSAARAFPAAARANTSIFFGQDRRRRLRSLSVPEVYAKLHTMIGDRLERFREVPTLASAEPQS